MSYRMPSTSERLFAPYKIAALVGVLRDSGVPVEACLRDSGLDAPMLDDPACRTSIDQYLQTCSQALRLSPDPRLPFRAGSRLHLSDHGMVGLLLLSCESVRAYVAHAVRYQLLATPTVAIDAVEDGAHVAWVIPDDALCDLPDALRRFLIAQQFAQQATHLDDVLGHACAPALACFDHPAPADRAVYEQALGCPCVFDWHRCELRYPAQILDRRPYLANPLAASMLTATCDGLLADMEASIGIAGQVHRTLSTLGDPGAGMKAVAAALKMAERTLRRRLADEGTSFSTIAHLVKYGVATRHLKGGAASIDQIAAIAGFSDSANFRRAFLRWTDMSPSQFRRQQRLHAT